MKRLLLAGVLAGMAALTHSPWAAAAFLVSILGIFVYGILDVTR